MPPLCSFLLVFRARNGKAGARISPVSQFLLAFSRYYGFYKHSMCSAVVFHYFICHFYKIYFRDFILFQIRVDFFVQVARDHRLKIPACRSALFFVALFVLPACNPLRRIFFSRHHFLFYLLLNSLYIYNIIIWGKCQRIFACNFNFRTFKIC